MTKVMIIITMIIIIVVIRGTLLTTWVRVGLGKFLILLVLCALVELPEKRKHVWRTD